MTRSPTTPSLTTTFTLPEPIAAGLADRTYERVGGVIRDVATQRIVAWLRDTGRNPALAQIPGVLQLKLTPLQSEAIDLLYILPPQPLAI